jgi:hypothetical protein
VHLGALGDQPVARPAGGEELGVHVLGHRDRAVAVADRRVHDVEQGHRGAAVRGADRVEQLRAHRHRRAGVAGPHLLQPDPQQLGQRVGGQPGEQRGGDVGSVVRSGIGHDRRL